MNFNHSDHEQGIPRSGAENTSTSLFPNWDQTYHSRIIDCSLHMGNDTPVSSSYNDYSLPQYNNQINTWPTLPPEEPLLPEDLANLQIQPLESRSSWQEGAPERSLFPAHCEDSLAVSPPIAERRSVDPYTLSNLYNHGYCNIVPNTSPNSTFSSYCPTSPEDNRLLPATEYETQLPNDQDLGLTKDGRPRKRRPKKSLLNYSEEEKRAHEREVNKGSTNRYRTKKSQQRGTLEQQLQQETERKAALEQVFMTKTMELETLTNEFYSCSLVHPSRYND